MGNAFVYSSPQLPTTTEVYMHVGKSLKVALAKSGQNQDQLAKKMSCTRVWISRLANSESASLDTISKLASAFDMKVSDFLKLGED